MSKTNTDAKYYYRCAFSTGICTQGEKDKNYIPAFNDYNDIESCKQNCFDASPTSPTPVFGNWKAAQQRLRELAEYEIKKQAMRSSTSAYVAPSAAIFEIPYVMKSNIKDPEWEKRSQLRKKEREARLKQERDERVMKSNSLKQQEKKQSRERERERERPLSTSQHTADLVSSFLEFKTDKSKKLSKPLTTTASAAAAAARLKPIASPSSSILTPGLLAAAEAARAKLFATS